MLLLLLACAPELSPADPRPPARAAPPALETIALGEFAYIGPGSMGKFVSYARHPSLPELLLAGADVGGLYLSEDDGERWTNITRDLPANGVWSLALSISGEGSDERTRVLVGSDTGLYRSEDLDSSDGITADEITGFTAVDGLDFGDERADQDDLRALAEYNLSWKTLPIGALTVDPSNPELVWAGVAASANVNLAQDPKDPYSLQHFDRWKVYRSVDGGVSFAPALRFSEPIAAFVAPGYDDDGSVFDILVDPDDSGRVWVASDRGLYAADNADTTDDADGDGRPDILWSERGIATRRESADLGETWELTDPQCEDWADGSLAPAWCLPVIANATVELVLDPTTGWPSPGFETHPNTRSLAISTVGGQERLYISVWDRGHAEDQPEKCSTGTDADSFKDEALAYTRGGAYVSEDGGETWAWMLTDTGAPGTATGTTPLLTDLRYRCDALTSERSSDADTTYLHELQAPPESDQDFLMVGVLGSKSGLWRYDASDGDDPWLWLSDQGAEGYDDRFEGARPLNISKGRKIEIQRMLVSWDEVVDGWPRVEFGLRGMLRATYDTGAGWYLFEHLGSAYADTIDDLPAWQGTGLDDAVVWDVLEVGDQLYAGVSDGAVLRAEKLDGVWTWTAPATELWTPNWSTDTDDFRKDETHSVVYDETSGLVYATNYATATDYLYSILSWDGATWRVVGGYGWTTDASLSEDIRSETMNGLFSGSPYAPLELYELLVVPPEADASLDLLLASSDGLWAYDAEAAADAQWGRLCADLTERHAWAELELNLDLVPGYAFAVSDTRQKGGLLAIDLAAGTCESLRTATTYDAETGAVDSTQDPVSSPTAVALGTDELGQARLLVGAGSEGFGALYSGPIDCAAGCAVESWTRAMSLSGLYDADDPRAPILEVFEVTAIAVDPTDPRLAVISVGAKPGWDFYNPDWMFATEDGGQSVSRIDFDADDHGLPNRSHHMLEFSADGATLYSGSRSSLFAMPVSW